LVLTSVAAKETTMGSWTHPGVDDTSWDVWSTSSNVEPY